MRAIRLSARAALARGAEWLRRGSSPSDRFVPCRTEDDLAKRGAVYRKAETPGGPM